MLRVPLRRLVVLVVCVLSPCVCVSAFAFAVVVCVCVCPCVERGHDVTPQRGAFSAQREHAAGKGKGRGGSGMDDQTEDDDTTHSSASVPRSDSGCRSLLDFLVFPCAQTVLSAVACTDTRQPEQSYLNLFPNQACDEEWRRTVLPPAVLGLLFWIVAFPLGSTLMLMRLRSKLAASSASASSSCFSHARACFV